MTLVLTREYVVRDNLPAAVILQDYYDPEAIVLRNYTIPSCERDEQDIVDLQLPLRSDVLQEGVRSEGAHLSNFRNVDHEPDFPDGPEANLPVTVPAPEN